MLLKFTNLSLSYAVHSSFTGLKLLLPQPVSHENIQAKAEYFMAEESGRKHADNQHKAAFSKNNYNHLNGFP